MSFPPRVEYDAFEHDITHHTIIHEYIKRVVEGFRYDAHPMGMFVSMVAALSTFYPDAKNVRDAESRALQTHRLIAKVPTIAAFAYRHTIGMRFTYPDNDLSYTGQLPEDDVLHDEQLHPRPGSGEGARGAVHPSCRSRAELLGERDAERGKLGSGPLLQRPLLQRPRSTARSTEAPTKPCCACLQRDRLEGQSRQASSSASRNGEDVRLMGFGHRVYKSYDPRATIIKTTAHEVFEVTGKNPLIDIAVELERIALQEDYFVKRRLYPNVDFYSGIIYEAMGFPVSVFPVLFAIPRTSGWIAQWEEMLMRPRAEDRPPAAVVYR